VSQKTDIDAVGAAWEPLVLHFYGSDLHDSSEKSHKHQQLPNPKARIQKTDATVETFAK
jgi:hypothetical protein